MKILFIGEIVARPGRTAVSRVIPSLIKKHNFDLVLANAENLTHGRGVSKEHLMEMIQSGVDYFTGGDHIFWRKESLDYFEDLPIVRPLNYPGEAPGVGYKVVSGKNDSSPRLLLINAMGRTSFGGPQTYLDDPFTSVETVLNKVRNEEYDFSLVDFHAEATSEKSAFGFYLDGKVDAIVGTHTHVPTCDQRVLPLGTAFITDVGMCGNIDSVLGVQSQIVINQFLTAQNQRFEWESTGKVAFRSVIIDMQNKTVERYDEVLS